MLCPNCQTPTDDQAALCPACGAELPKETPAPAEDDYAAQQARYQEELAAYQWQQAAYQQQQHAQQTATAPQPKKGKGGTIAVVLVIALLLLAACGIGGIFAARALFQGNTEVESGLESGTPVDEGAETLEQGAGFATAEEALLASLSEDGLADWVYDVTEEGAGYVVYVAGPPASEYASQYTVSEGADGTWSVSEVVALGFEDVEAGSAMEAEQVVWEYLICVYEDRGLDAQGWTVDPFRSDSASAQVSAGGLTDYGIVGSFGEPDGSFRIQTSQMWYGSNENWEYWVVPTEAGYRIADVQPW